MTDPRSNSLHGLDAELADDVGELLSDLGAIDGMFGDVAPAAPPAPRAAPARVREHPSPAADALAVAEPVHRPDQNPAAETPPAPSRPRGLVRALAALNAPVLRMSDRGRRTVDVIALALTLAVAVIWFFIFRSR